MKKYLVIVAGSPRGGERTWSSLKKYVLDYLDADLAICCSDKWDQSTTLFKIAKYKWIFKEFKDYFEYYDNNFIGSWKEYFELGEHTGLKSSGSIHFVFKDIVLKKYLNYLIDYEYIIYTRFDQLYVDYHPKGVKGKILIPSGEDYFGICDRHAIFDSKLSQNFLNICNYVNSKKALQNASNFENCETTFMKALINENVDKLVERYSRSQFTANIKNEHTNWRVAKYKLYLMSNLMIKYPDEFIDSFNNIIKKYGLNYSLKKEFLLTLNYLYLRFRTKLGKYKWKKNMS